jgi:hypothetical protein
MRKDARTIFKFLQRFEAEFIGHKGEPPPIEIREKLRQLARGEISGPERAALVDLLAAHPEWIPSLADDVKLLRKRGDNHG